ncbi:acyltransferase family protein [Arthrobacter castelli]|uniref:acyltransferase family protein n=1 Tax=Arthrobacter castelli TaxID=271431 RepID=UPI000688C517|nr:acyltransferase family protein [Arthrobacter castelli]
MATSTRRDQRLDSAKGILISLVVLGHLLEATSAWNADVIRLPLTIIYMFHMPAFIFLSGMTAKRDNLSRRIGVFLVLLLTFQGLYYVAVWLSPLERDFSPFMPFWLLWFLLSMIWWLLLLPLVWRMPRTAVAVSVVIAISAGAIDEMGYAFSISRVLVFLPFFITGTVYGRQILDVAGRIPFRVKLCAAVLCLALGWILFAADIHQGWLYGSYSFDRLDTGTVEGLAVRAGLLAVAGFTTVTVLSLMPRHQNPVTAIGKRSLGIFLVHGFVVLALTPLLPPGHSGANTAIALAACVAIAVVVVKVLGAAPIDRSVRQYGSKVVDLASGLLKRNADRQVAGR